MSLAIPPEPLRNVTIEGCSIYEETGNTSLQVAWQLPVKTYGMLRSCSLNISILEDNATAPFVFGVTTEVRILEYTMSYVNDIV